MVAADHHFRNSQFGPDANFFPKDSFGQEDPVDERDSALDRRRMRRDIRDPRITRKRTPVGFDLSCIEDVSASKAEPTLQLGLDGICTLEAQFDDSIRNSASHGRRDPVCELPQAIEQFAIARRGQDEARTRRARVGRCHADIQAESSRELRQAARHDAIQPRPLGQLAHRCVGKIGLGEIDVDSSLLGKIAQGDRTDLAAGFDSLG